MQFQYNNDFPTVDPQTGQEIMTMQQAALPPLPFPPAKYVPCASLTTRVYLHSSQKIITVANVLIRVGGSRQQDGSEDLLDDDDDDDIDDDDDDDDDDMLLEDPSNSANHEHGTIQSTPTTYTPTAAGNIPTTTASSNMQAPDRAYWIQRTLREAIYGKVMLAIVLERLPPSSSLRRQTGITVEWQTTPQFCAVKEMSWSHIQKEQHRLAEDPVKEVASMQYLRQWYQQHTSQQRLSPAESSTLLPEGCQDPLQAMLETNIIMPLDLLSDERCMYSIMPYCDGGELFERLDTNERFSEEEARFWMRQLLNGLEHLQKAGICHRDISLENLLVHQQSGALIIDMGMCLRIPSRDPADCYPRRSLIAPQGTCGKWIYMSPEIYKSHEPFDGYAVDLWAAGVVLFLMLTGFPPWERACLTDDRFKYMTGGYLVQMLTEWKIPISPDAMDLLQRMLFLDPKDRLSLAQVRAHPWMLTR